MAIAKNPLVGNTIITTNTDGITIRPPEPATSGAASTRPKAYTIREVKNGFVVYPSYETEYRQGEMFPYHETYVATDLDHLSTILTVIYSGLAAAR